MFYSAEANILDDLGENPPQVTFVAKNFSPGQLPVPGIDLVPCWTLAVINVYRKWKQITITIEETREQRPALKGQQNSS